MLNNIPKIIGDFALEEIDGETLLFSPTSTRTVYLNGTATLIWRLCDGETSVDEIIQLLGDAFPDAADAIESDVLTTMKQFLENQAIEMTA